MLIDASVIYIVDPGRLVQIHVTWQDRYSADLVRPLTRRVIHDAVSQYGIEQVYSSERLEMVENIRAELNQKLADNGLTLPQMGPQLPDAAAAPVEPTAQPTPLPTPTVVMP